MDEIIPWEEWVEFIRPYYPSGKRGRPVKGIEIMLRMYLIQNWFNLSDEGVEDAIYDSYAFRKFMKINFMTEQVPDATTLLEVKSPFRGKIWCKISHSCMKKAFFCWVCFLTLDCYLFSVSLEIASRKVEKMNNYIMLCCIMEMIMMK